MRKYVKESIWDHNSVSLFDYDRKNEFGEMYCIAPAILSREIDFYWDNYIRSQSSFVTNYNGYKLRKTNWTTGTPAQAVYEIFDDNKCVVNFKSHLTIDQAKEYIDLVLA